MKRLIIILVVILVVAGGGAGGLMMLGIVKNPFAKPTPEQVAAAAAAAEKAKRAAGPTEAFTQVKVPDLIIPVIVRGEVQRRIYINLRLHVETTAKDRVQKELPRYQSVVLSDLVTYFQTYFERNDMIDIAVVKKKLSTHAAKLYGEQVKEVFLINVFESGLQSGSKGSFVPAAE